MSEGSDRARRGLRRVAVYFGLTDDDAAPHVDTRSRARRLTELTVLIAVISLFVGVRLTVAHGAVCFALLFASSLAREFTPLGKAREGETASFVGSTAATALTMVPVMVFIHAAFSRDDPFTESVVYGLFVGTVTAAGIAFEDRTARRKRRQGKLNAAHADARRDAAP